MTDKKFLNWRNQKMKIILKKNNIPTEPGYYLLKRPNKNSRTELAQIRFSYDKLYLFSGISSFPLHECVESLWSDKLTIEDPPLNNFVD